MTQQRKILITEKINESGINKLREHFFVKYCEGGLSRDELLEEIGEYDAIIVRVMHRINKEILDKAEKLKIIAMAGIGLDHIDVEYAKARGIKVINVSDASINSVAELTVGLMINLCRNVNSAFVAVKAGNWDKNKFVGMQLKGKTLGLIALGKIGEKVARICQSMEMTVIAYDPYVSTERAAQLNVRLVDFDLVLRESDVISIHAPLVKSTYHMIGKGEIDKMKDGVILLNLGRGGIIDEEALYRNLKSGKIKGFAADVLEKEPPGKNKLFELSNVLVTPHIGASTYEAQRMISEKIAEEILEFFKRGKLVQQSA